jgi:hypothetical protein
MHDHEARGFHSVLLLLLARLVSGIMILFVLVSISFSKGDVVALLLDLIDERVPLLQS